MSFGRHMGEKKQRFWAAAALWAAAASLFAGGCTFEHDQLLQDLKSDRDEIRATAIRKIGKNPWPNDDAILFQAASDKSALVRIAAIEALYMTDDPRVQDLLPGLIEDGLPEIQRMAVQGLLRKPTPKNLAYLRNAYVRSGWMTRRIIGEYASAEQIRMFVQSDAESIWDGVVKDFEQEVPARLETASVTAAKSGREEVAAKLTSLLESSSAPIPVISGAGKGLAELGQTVGAEILVKILENEKQPAVRSAALEALSNFKIDAQSESSRKMMESVIPKISELASQNTPDAEVAFEVLAKMSASNETGANSRAVDALCAQLLSSTPANAESRAAAVFDSGVRCDLAGLRENLKMGGTAAQAALQILAKFPDPSMADAVNDAFKSGDPELMADAWKAMGPLAPSSEKVSESLRLSLDKYFENAAAAHEKWIPEGTIHGLWPEDFYEDMKPAMHEHRDHGHDDDKPLAEEDFRGGKASLGASDIKNMVDQYNATLEKKKGKRKDLTKLMELLDKAAKERSEALGLKTGEDLSKVFAYHRRDIVPDETPAREAIFTGMLSALPYFSDYPISEKFLRTLWDSSSYRVNVCEIAGSRFENEGEKPEAAPESGKKGSDAIQDEAASSSVSGKSEKEAAGDAQDKPLEMDNLKINVNEIVRRCLRSRVPEEQSAVLNGLVRRGTGSVPAILETLKVRTEQRTPLVEALIKLGAANQLTAWARGKLPAGGDESIAALKIIRATKDASFIPDLIQALNMPALPDELRCEIIETLGNVDGRGPGVREALELELFNNSDEVRAAALQVLKDSGQLDSTPKAKAFQADYSAKVRKLAGGN